MGQQQSQAGGAVVRSSKAIRKSRQSDTEVTSFGGTQLNPGLWLHQQSELDGPPQLYRPLFSYLENWNSASEVTLRLKSLGPQSWRSEFNFQTLLTIFYPLFSLDLSESHLKSK